MLWYKSWLETRWRFVIGLVLLMLSACATVLVYPRVMQLLSNAPRVEASGVIGRQISEGLDLARSYRGYVWSQWYRQNLMQLWTFFAVLLASGSVLSQASGGGTLFTLALPVTRKQVLGVRAATGLAELLLLAFVPSLLIPVLSPAVGQSYSVGDALVHGACLFVAGATFFSLAFLLSTVFGDLWRPLLITCAIAVVLSLFGQVFPDISRYSIFSVMNGEGYFRGDGWPWPGLLVSAALSVALLYGATTNIARQDF